MTIDRGVVVTNCHVLQNGDSFSVSTADIRRSGRLVAGSLDLDICFIDHEPFADVRPAKVARLPSTGERVFAVGNPLGLENTISEGIVSGIRRIENVNLIQTTAPISPGSSGGGLFNGKAELVGITTFQFRGQNLNFAVPADYIAAVLASRNLPDLTSRKDAGAVLAYKSIPLGITYEEFTRRKNGCRCDKYPDLPAICMCYEETYFGAPAYVMFLFRDRRRLDGVSVGIPLPGRQLPAEELSELYRTMLTEFSRLHGSPSKEEGALQKDGRYRHTTSWTVGRGVRTLIREHATPVQGSPIVGVSAGISTDVDRTPDRKDY